VHNNKFYKGVCVYRFLEGEIVSEEIESKVMGKWHHPKIGKGPDGRAIFLPSMQYGVMLRDTNFKVWLDHYRGKSSRKIAMLTVYRLMKAGDLASPTEFLELPVPTAKNIVRLVCNELAGEGYMQAARQTLSFAKSFYNYHNEDYGKELKFKRSERPIVTSKKISREMIPHNSDIYKLADVAQGLKYRDNTRNRLLGLRNRAIILFLWASGVRVNTLCKLRYKHIKDYIEGKLSFKFLKEQFKEANIEYWESLGLKISELPPLFLKVTPELDSKIGSYGLNYYVTFLNREAFQALKEWLTARAEAAGKPIGPEDYVFVAFDFSKNKLGEKPLTSHLVNHMLKTVAGRAGMDGQRLWVHVLRKSFRKVLRANPILDDETREALMGHKLPRSQSNYFDYHDIIDVARKYLQCDWTAGEHSKLNGLTKQVDEQAETIKRLQAELEHYKLREAQIAEKAAALEKLLQRVEELEKRLKS
jgi:site-specific recombinase XerD